MQTAQILLSTEIEEYIITQILLQATLGVIIVQHIVQLKKTI